MDQQTTEQQQSQPFTLKSYPVFNADNEPSINFLVDGLLPEGGLSLIGAKPKDGKSSLARALSLAVAQGIPFLGRNTERGEVLIISLEDSRSHIALHFRVLGHDDASDERIEVMNRIGSNLKETIPALRTYLTNHTSVRLVVIDTLAKFIRSDDLNDYSKTQKVFQILEPILKDFPKVHFCGIAHSKKSSSKGDLFDSILGSTAIRGEATTSIVLFMEGGKRIIAAETRIGRPIPPTVLEAEMEQQSGADLAKNFYLAEPVGDALKNLREATEGQPDYEERILKFIRNRGDGCATQQELRDGGLGKTVRVVEATKELVTKGIISASGNPQRFSIVMNTATKDAADKEDAE